MTLLKQAIYIKYVIAKLLKFVQICIQTFSDSFLQEEDSLKTKKTLEIVSRSHFW